MAINKVVYESTTLIDLTGTTATADKILSGYGAYGKDGVWMAGSASAGVQEVVIEKHQAGQNQTISHTFTKAYKKAVITTGGYGNASIASGTGWTQQYHDGSSSSNSSYGWTKDNVASGESVSVKCNNRYGIAFIGIN